MFISGSPTRTRTDENRYLWRSFRHHSRTFSLAARLLPRPVRLPVATLYMFCRTIDTIADERVHEVGADQALRELHEAREHLRHTLAGRPPSGLLWTRMAEVHEAFTFYTDPLYELIDGAAWDLEGRGIEDRADLIHYSDLVGGTVGAMMLPFLVYDRADVERLEEPARALGIAMQITNILRDVGEDRRDLDRCYVPRTWLRAHGVALHELDETCLPEAYPELLEALMELAEEHYEQGFAGINGLSWRVQPAILAAARMYREIMNEVRARQYDNLTQRAYVPFRRKLRLVVQDDYLRRKDQLSAQSTGLLVWS